MRRNEYCVCVCGKLTVGFERKERKKRRRGGEVEWNRRRVGLGKVVAIEKEWR